MRKQKIYYPEIDFIKAFAIMSVVILHLLVIGGHKEVLFKIATAFHIWQAVPLFMFLFGLTLRVSVEKGSNAVQILSHRMTRLLIPLLNAYLIAFIIRYSIGYNNIIDWHIFIGLIPTPGMGTYFITLYLETIIALVVLYYIVKRYSFYFVLFIAILISIIGEFISYGINIKDMYLYSASIHRYIVFIVLGYYFFDYKYNKNYFLLMIFIVISIFLLILFQFSREPIWPYYLYESAKLWQFQHFPYAFYTLFLVSVIVYVYNKFLKSIQKNIGFILYIGKASLHIYLTQIFVFFLIKQMQVSVDVKIQSITFIFILTTGCLWFYMENIILQKAKINAD